MKTQTKSKQEKLKSLIVDILISDIKSAIDGFNTSEVDDIIFKKIFAIDTADLAAVANVTEGMARKYKSGESSPSLPGSVLIEEAFNIPPRYWVKLKSLRVQGLI